MLRLLRCSASAGITTLSRPATARRPGPAGRFAFRLRTRYDSAMPNDPFARAYCPAAWRGADYFAPADWSRSAEGVAATGLRALLRRAQLPLEELRHMGAPGWALEAHYVGWVPESVAVPLLGRIVWDAEVGAAGYAWSGSDLHQWDAQRLGEAVVARFFRP